MRNFNRLGSKCTELDANDKLRIFHDFYRTGEETAFSFDMAQTMRKGHDFKDYICPDSFEFEKDYFKMGNRYGRVIFLREYAAYIKDSMVAELCELNRNMMLSVDVVLWAERHFKEHDNRQPPPSAERKFLYPRCVWCGQVVHGKGGNDEHHSD